MEAKPEKLKLNYKFWLETESGISILGEGKWLLLKAIDKTGSLKEAAASLNLAYRQTWENLRLIEEKLGFQLIEKSRGGERGGQTTLTPRGRQVVAFFDKLYHEMQPEISRKFNEFLDDLNELTS